MHLIPTINNHMIVSLHKQTSLIFKNICEIAFIDHIQIDIEYSLALAGQLGHTRVRFTE